MQRNKEYIEREEALRQIFLEAMGHDFDFNAEYRNIYISAKRAIKNTPAADVVEVRHAKWVSLAPPLLLEEFREMEADKFFMCSKCKGECQLVEQDDYYDYCPRCGCKMDKEE